MPDTPPEEPERSNRRDRLLQVGIDVKWLCASFFATLKADHGQKRCDRLMDYLTHGCLDGYSWAQRQNVYADRRRLGYLLNKYKGRK